MYIVQAEYILYELFASFFAFNQVLYFLFWNCICCRDHESLDELGGAAGDVSKALNELLNHVKDSGPDKIPDIMDQEYIHRDYLSSNVLWTAVFLKSRKRRVQKQVVRQLEDR